MDLTLITRRDLLMFFFKEHYGYAFMISIDAIIAGILLIQVSVYFIFIIPILFVTMLIGWLYAYASQYKREIYKRRIDQSPFFVQIRSDDPREYVMFIIQIGEIMKWCNEHTKFHLTNVDSIENSITFRFLNQDDAALFKLRWM